MTKLPKVIKQIREHKLLEIDKETQKNISYSQMQVYDQCPHRWKLTYKDKIKVYKPSIHTVFGKGFHETVQDWLTTLYEVSGVAADAMELEDKLYEGLIFHYSDEKKNNEGEL